MTDGQKADDPATPPQRGAQSHSFPRESTKPGIADAPLDSRPTISMTPAPTSSTAPAPVSGISAVHARVRPEALATQATAPQLGADPELVQQLRQGAGREHFAAGTMIGDVYRIGQPLGEGGMGVVLHARDLNLQRDVAIKLIQPELVLADSVRQSFRNEAQAMARVRHENVVMVHAYGEVEQIPYFVMEYVEGIDVAALQEARPNQPLNRDDVMKIIRQAAAGVDAIHAAGAIHLDLKPSNLLIGEGFRVVVTDLGIARIVERRAEDSSIAGTPSYMAPELVMGGVPTPAADVYALAVMTYELLTGKLPFGLLFGLKEILAAALRAPTPPSEVNPALPAELDEAILRGMNKHPDQRPRSAGEFATSLFEAITASTKNPQRLSFLVADDDPDMRDIAVAMLEETFNEPRIRVAPNGATAYKMLCHEPAALALIDLQMPGLNGVELTAELRGNELTKTMPIIVMTAVGGASDWRVLASLGANAFLVKPFDEMQLELAVRRLLALT